LVPPSLASISMAQQPFNSSQSFLNRTGDTNSRTGLERIEPTRYSSESKPTSLPLPHPAPALQSHHLTILLFSLLLIILSAPIIALGAFTGFKSIPVGFNGCQGCWRISAPDWDAAVAFYGSVLGAIGATLLHRVVTSIAQRQLMTQKGATLRMFRGLAILDILHLVQTRSSSFALQRSWALPILLATFLASSSTIALIGTHTVPGTIRNPLGSAALGLLNNTLFYNAPDGALFPDLVDIDPSNFDGPVVKAARIISLQALGKYDSNYAQQNDLFLGGQIGNSTYEDLDTGGIGVNVNSYLRFSGNGDFFNPPTNYTFNRLTGVAWGINTTVQCAPTNAFTVTPLSVAFGHGNIVRVFNVSGPAYNMVFSSPQDSIQPYAFTVLASNLALPSNQLNSNDWVNLVVLMPTYLDETTFVYMCSISARQYLASVSVTGVGGTVQYSPLDQSKDVSGPFLSQDQATFLETLINVRVGGAIAAVMGDQIIDPNSTIPIEGVLSNILSAATRIRMTVRKQHYERASASIPGISLDQTYFELEYNVQQVGSGRKGLFWLFLPILMFLTGIGGLLFSLARGETAIVDLTDPVAVSAIMVGSSIPELEGRSSGNPTALDCELLDEVELVLRVKGDRRIEFTTDKASSLVNAKEKYS
jgi:uncharacterized membrane protein YgdD (TMEM256/DUF423 family)